jgi:hypothetical protein
MPSSAGHPSRNDAAGSSMEEKVKQLRKGKKHQTITEEDEDSV